MLLSIVCYDKFISSLKEIASVYDSYSWTEFMGEKIVDYIDDFNSIKDEIAFQNLLDRMNLDVENMEEHHFQCVENERLRREKQAKDVAESIKTRELHMETVHSDTGICNCYNYNLIEWKKTT